MDQNAEKIQPCLGTFEMGKLAGALAKAQAAITPPAKNRKVDFTDKNGRRVNYAYADLADVLACIRDPLSSNELALYHHMGYEGGAYGMTTVLRHSSNQYISTWYPLPDPQRQQIRPQEFGSSLTYARRYSISCLVGIASEEDDDGAAGAPTPQPKAKPPITKPAAAPAKAATAPATKAPPTAKPPPQNHAPADDAQLARLDALMSERGITEDCMTYLLQQGYQTNSERIPKPILAEIINLIDAEGVTDATLMARAQQLMNEREAAKLNSFSDDPLDKVSPMGLEKGKRFSQIKESKLIEMIMWSRNALKEKPGRKDNAVIAQFQADATAFLRDRGVEI